MGLAKPAEQWFGTKYFGFFVGRDLPAPDVAPATEAGGVNDAWMTSATYSWIWQGTHQVVQDVYKECLHLYEADPAKRKKIAEVAGGYALYLASLDYRDMKGEKKLPVCWKHARIFYCYS